MDPGSKKQRLTEKAMSWNFADPITGSDLLKFALKVKVGSGASSRDLVLWVHKAWLKVV
jgi:hypothetical protein